MHTPESASTLIADKVVMVGSWLSTTVTVCVDVAVFPEVSVTVHVTAFGPATKEAGVAITLATPQLSEVVGAVN